MSAAAVALLLAGRLGAGHLRADESDPNLLAIPHADRGDPYGQRGGHRSDQPVLRTVQRPDLARPCGAHAVFPQRVRRHVDRRSGVLSNALSTWAQCPAENGSCRVFEVALDSADCHSAMNMDRSSPRPVKGVTLTRATDDRRPMIRSILLIAVLVCGLVAYKGFVAATVIRLATATGSIPAKARIGLILPGHTSTVLNVISRSTTYLITVGPALLFGILISGAVRACVSPYWLARVIGRHPLRQQLVAGVAGRGPHAWIPG